MNRAGHVAVSIEIGRYSNMDPHMKALDSLKTSGIKRDLVGHFVSRINKSQYSRMQVKSRYVPIEDKCSPLGGQDGNPASNTPTLFVRLKLHRN